MPKEIGYPGKKTREKKTKSRTIKKAVKLAIKKK